MNILNNIKYIFGEQDHNVIGVGLSGILYEKIYLILKRIIIENKIVSITNTFYIFLLIFAKKKRDTLQSGMYICFAISVISIILSEKMFPMNEIYIPFIWYSLENLFYIKGKKYGNILLLGALFTISTALELILEHLQLQLRYAYYHQ